MRKNSVIHLTFAMLVWLALAGIFSFQGTGALAAPGPDPQAPESIPPDPTNDIPWNWNPDVDTTVSHIQAAFNNARAVENSQLGLSTPGMTMPSQAQWDAMDNNQRAFYLVNRERIDRGIHGLHNVQSDVIAVAQYYANYLLSHNVFSHYADGKDPWQRLNTVPAINTCHDPLPVVENLAVFVASVPKWVRMPVERSVYGWMYEDKSSAWGHRHTILYYNYTENGGLAGVEGFMGVGVAVGGPYQGPFPDNWAHAAIVVMNVFDPCASWNYTDIFKVFNPMIMR